jgi:hypothetical protein
MEQTYRSQILDQLGLVAGMVGLSYAPCLSRKVHTNDTHVQN